MQYVFAQKYLFLMYYLIPKLLIFLFFIELFQLD